MSNTATLPAPAPAQTATTPAADSAANSSRPADPRQAGFKEEIVTVEQRYNANVPLDVIERDPGNRVPTKEAVAALAETIRLEGLLQPVTLRDLGGGKYRIIAGETRCEAFRLLKRPTIPAMIRPKEAGAEAGPSQGDVAKRLVENLTRTDLNPVDQARGFKQLCELGRTQKEVGALFGLSQPVVANSIRILALPEDVLDLIREGKLSAAHGVSLARFAKFPKIVSRMADCAVENRLHSAKDLDRAEVPFMWELKRGGWVIDIKTRACSWESEPAYVVPEELLKRPEFIEADHCVYYLREPGTPDLWTPEKKRQDEERAAKAQAAAAKQAKAVASGKKTAEQIQREKKLVANRRMRWELGRARRDAIDALIEAKEITTDMLAVLIEHALSHNGNGNALGEAQADTELFGRVLKTGTEVGEQTAYWDFDYADPCLMGEPLKAVKLAVAAILIQEHEGDMKFLGEVSPELRIIARSAPARTAEQQLAIAAEGAEITSAKFVVIAAALADEDAKVGDIAKRNGVTPDKVKAVRAALEFDDALRTICAQMHATAEALRNKDPHRAAAVAKGKKGGKK